jgi:hypothetical protein
MTERLGLKGTYLFEGYKAGKLVDVRKYDNIITQLFYDRLWSFINADNETPDFDALAANYFATGTDATVATISDTLLVAEGFRKAISTKNYTDSVFSMKTLLGTADSNFTIREVGIFAGATDTTDSGILLSRCNVNIEKLSTIQYFVTYTITRS